MGATGQTSSDTATIAPGVRHDAAGHRDRRRHHRQHRHPGARVVGAEAQGQRPVVRRGPEKDDQEQQHRRPRQRPGDRGPPDQHRHAARRPAPDDVLRGAPLQHDRVDEDVVGVGREGESSRERRDPGEHDGLGHHQQSDAERQCLAGPDEPGRQRAVRGALHEGVDVALEVLVEGVGAAGRERAAQQRRQRQPQRWQRPSGEHHRGQRGGQQQLDDPQLHQRRPGAQPRGHRQRPRNGRRPPWGPHGCHVRRLDRLGRARREGSSVQAVAPTAESTDRPPRSSCQRRGGACGREYAPSGRGRVRVSTFPNDHHARTRTYPYQHHGGPAGGCQGLVRVDRPGPAGGRHHPHPGDGLRPEGRQRPPGDGDEPRPCRLPAVPVPPAPRPARRAVVGPRPVRAVVRSLQHHPVHPAVLLRLRPRALRPPSAADVGLAHAGAPRVRPHHRHRGHDRSARAGSRQRRRHGDGRATGPRPARAGGAAGREPVRLPRLRHRLRRRHGGGGWRARPARWPPPSGWATSP